HHVEVVRGHEGAQLGLEPHADREVHEGPVERDHDVVADPHHSGGVLRLALTEAAGDDRDVVAALAQLQRRVVDVLGDPAVARVVGLRDDADSHAGALSAAPVGSCSAAGTASHSGRKMHHWSMRARMWRSVAAATAALSAAALSKRAGSSAGSRMNRKRPGPRRSHSPQTMSAPVRWARTPGPAGKRVSRPKKSTVTPWR